MTSPDASAEAIFSLLEELLGRELDVTVQITAETRLLEDLALDSVGLTIVAVALENHFRIRLDEADATQIRTAGELVTLVQRRAREAA